MKLSYFAETPSPRGDPKTGAILLDDWDFEVFLDFPAMEDDVRILFPRRDSGFAELAIQPGGWQSWSAGWELCGDETLPRRVRILGDLIKQTNRDGDRVLPGNLTEDLKKTPRKSWIVGHFIMYFRVGDHYCCAASLEGDGLPPVSYRINRRAGRILPEIYCPGKNWEGGEALAEIAVFHAQGYFHFKDALRRLYRQEENFQTLDYLRVPGAKNKGKLPGGYESWYNRYVHINEEIILRDLESLGRDENLIKLMYLDRKKPAVFQIDDGWEMAVGDWEVDPRRFPRGLAPVAERIEEAGLIPGLWIAPFLVTKKARIFRERPGWLLQDSRKRPITAGFNHLWDKWFYCLDISRRDVLDYLKGIIDRALDQWGFRYLKLDFLYTGMFSGEFAEGGSPYEHYHRACELLTARTSTSSGLKAGYLGCGLPLGASYRRFPLSRIGSDTREEWDWKLVKWLGHVGRPSAYVSLMDTIGRAFMDGPIYVNDPDVIFLRSHNCSLTETEKECVALVNFLLGGQLMISDDTQAMTDNDRALTRRMAALFELLADDEYGPQRLTRDVFRLESKTGKTAGLINLGDTPYALTQKTEPRLFDALSKKTLLVDRRVKIEANRLEFAPHSISVYEASEGSDKDKDAKDK